MKDLARLGHLFVCVFLYHFSAFMVVPAITDVTMAALCPGRDQCGLAIYLSGFQQAITGLGTLMVTPLIGNLSDRYGRKALLTLPMTVAVIPLGKLSSPASNIVKRLTELWKDDTTKTRLLSILAFSRTETFFYIYYAVRIVAGMFCEGSMQCLPIAYVVRSPAQTQADKVGERRRASAIGVLSGFSMAGFVSGTLTSRFLSTTLTFRVSASVAVAAAVYMRVFLVESNRGGSGGGHANEGDASQAFLEAKTSVGAEAREETPVLSSSKGASLWDMIRLLRSSLTFSRAAILAFLSSLGDGGLHSSLLYYLKARFHFNKDQFADLLLIAGTAGAISQVPYLASMFVVMSIFSQPCIRSIVSKKVGPSEQGMAQGCISGIHSFANILSPLAFTPLTALFLSESAPFYFPGFSLMCVGFVSMAAFIQSVIMMRPKPKVCSHKFSNDVQH
ncbi:hypothetical protein Taro_017296 [Colocasia esculenta]|uniref:Major facilitator superfamily (MFS) profile domain-containing protein n=1 Tax=Colocasia esculenta TaxID=4460 RepID=A0A843UQT1_COLES|nr:hypothetical protein [Colocasia esculenta]